jgi:PTS system nitrogen regulatory IIA component
MVKITRYLDPRLVMLLSTETRDDTLHALTEKLHGENKLHDSKIFFDSILEREKIVSTGIGMGVAIPHAKLPDYNEFFIAVGILQKGVDWKALDGGPVRIVFMIGGPDDKQTEYLQILSSLTMAIKDETRRKKLLTLTSPEKIIELFKGL